MYGTRLTRDMEGVQKVGVICTFEGLVHGPLSDMQIPGPGAVLYIFFQHDLSSLYNSKIIKKESRHLGLDLATTRDILMSWFLQHCPEWESGLYESSLASLGKGNMYGAYQFDLLPGTAL